MMKAFSYSLLFSAVAGALIEPRAAQFGGLGSLFGKSSKDNASGKPVKIETVKPRIRPTANRQFIRYGPIQLAPSKDGGESSGGHSHGGGGMGGKGGAKGLSMDPNGTPFSMMANSGYCTDCTVLAAQVDIVFENGTRADIVNGVYLHHLVAGMMGNTTGKGGGAWVDMCPKPKGGAKASGLAGLLGSLGSSLGAGGTFVGGAVDEFVDYFTSVDGRVNSGYFIPANNRMFLSGEVINYLAVPQNVYVRLDIEWVPGKKGVDAIKTPINVEGCDFTHAAFKTGAEKGKIVSGDFVVSRDVTVVCARAHMHDGGDAVTAFVNGKTVCKSTASYGSPSAQRKENGKVWTTISKISDCLEPFELKKGDVIRLEATYDNVAHPLRISHGEAQGNMAFMTFTVVPKNAKA